MLRLVPGRIGMAGLNYVPKFECRARWRENGVSRSTLLQKRAATKMGMCSPDMHFPQPELHARIIQQQLVFGVQKRLIVDTA